MTLTKVIHRGESVQTNRSRRATSDRKAAENRGRDGERRAAWWLWLRGWRILDQRRPDDTDETGRIEAVAMTPIFGFRQDVVIRIEPNGEGTLVDMRSTARNGAHDLGADAARIRDFFIDLDASLQGISEQ